MQEGQKQNIQDGDTQELVDHILVDCIVVSVDNQYLDAYATENTQAFRTGPQKIVSLT